MTREPVLLTQEQKNEQREAMRLVAAHPDKPSSYYIVTYGCQMNAHDSETLSGMLREMGLCEASSREEADFVLFNTCCVRDNAERRALGNIYWLDDLRKKKPGLLIGVCGCMIQQPQMAERILRQYRFIDLAFGTHNLYQLPSLMLKLLNDHQRVVRVTQEETLIAEGLPVKRLNPYHAYITIMYGCDNFCSYCIVPYVRGRERSRSSADVLREAEELLRGGTQEIMLLGQNVNSYRDKSGMSFPKLLKALDELGVPRIRFMTSHPKDLSDELIDVMAGSRHICNHLHLPVQSGNNAILERMNRRYTRQQYLARVAALRQAIPNLGLTTDLIVGFPGETEEQFTDTLSLVNEVGYDAAFTFIYSPREGTRAAVMPDQVPAEVSTERIKRLIAAVEASAARVHQGLIGTREEVLVEGISKRDEHQVSGKGKRSITLTFEGDEQDVGKIVPVSVVSSAANTLRATRIEKE